MSKKIIIVLICLLFVISNSVFANGGEEKTVESWPTGNVQLVVAAKAGGGTDLVARVIAEKVSKIVGKNVVVVNKTEGGGAVAFDTVMNDDEDTLQLGFFIPSFFTNYITGSIDMNPKTDFKCASYLNLTDANFFVVAKDSPFKTMGEVIDYLKKNPGGLTLGLSLGSRTHFTVAEFAKAAGIEFKYVEAGNAADQTTALLGGHIDITLLNVANTKTYVEAGSMRALCVTDVPADRSGAIADVPTFAEIGYKDLKCKCDFFVTTSTKATDEQLDVINAAFAKALEDQDVQAGLLKLGYKAVALNRADSEMSYISCYDTFDSVGASLGVKVR